MRLVRKVTAEEMADELAAGDLLALELELCDREPYLRIGGMWQLVAQK